MKIWTVAIALMASLLGGCGRVPPPSPQQPAVADSAATEPAERQGAFESPPAESPSAEATAQAMPNGLEPPTTVDAEKQDAAAMAIDTSSPHGRVETGGSTSKVTEPESDAELPNSEASVEPADTQQPVPAERFMLLSPTGPLLVDLHITITGVPYQQSFDQVVSDVMAIADEDGDGTVSWQGIMSHPRFRSGQFGNPATSTYQAQQDMIRLYDTTVNDRVDADELVRYLTSNQGTSRAMALYTSNYRRLQNRDGSPTRSWLDVNNDLVLDADEIAGAHARLRLRDRDDDEILRPTDFVNLALDPNGMRLRRPRDSEYLPKVGWHVTENEPWSDMRVAWNEYYSVGQSVTVEDLAIGDDLFRQMDVDDSNSLDNIEMEMLLEADAHLSFNVDLAAEGSGESEIELTAMRLPADQVLAVVQHQPNRISIQLADTSLDIFANDAEPARGYGEQAMNLLRRGDADENNYLSEDEFGAVAASVNLEFEAVDVDADGKLTEQEITTVLEQRNIVRRNQIRVRADDQDDALLPTVDRNSDGRMDSRELSQVADSLLMLDQNLDGEIHLRELRGTMMLGVIRGGNAGVLQANDPTFQVPEVVRQPSESAPRWFTGMDRNRDAAISWREFLGTRVQFLDLDRNADGFVVLDEVPAE